MICNLGGITPVFELRLFEQPCTRFSMSWRNVHQAMVHTFERKRLEQCFESVSCILLI